MHSGNFVLILHTHLPWVLNHGNWPHGVDWANEAVAECYIPLMNVFNEMLDKGIKSNITLDISPVLCEQLEHPDFKKIYKDYCEEMITAAQNDRKQFKQYGHDPHHIYLTEFWEEWYTDKLESFEKKYNGSIIGGLRDLQDKDAIEIMTCGATHGYFPLLATDKSINLQVKAAKENYKKHFGRDPRGIWLPECAYRPSYDWQTYIPVEPYNQPRLRPGVEQFLAKHNIEYFVTDQKNIDNSWAIGAFDENKDFFTPVTSPDFKPVPWNFDKSPLRLYEVSSSEKVEYGTAAAFARHEQICMQVWSGDIGYPAEADYLDFHKKHFPSKLRYWRVTDAKADMMYKTLYHPDWVWDKLDKQAHHFIHNIENTVNYYKNMTGKFATLSAPFDTELFGHWWFEGPMFIKHLIEGLNNSPWVNMAKASEQYDLIKPQEVVGISEGSWGANNTHEVWSNEETKWTWEAIYKDERRLEHFFTENPIDDLNKTQLRIIKQAIRELMLMQASDWQFLIYTWSARDYAEQRFLYHHSDLNRLLDLAEEVTGRKRLKKEDKLYLEETEKRNSCFEEIDPKWWTDLY